MMNTIKQTPQDKNSSIIMSFRQPYTLQASRDPNTVQTALF